MRLGVVKHEGRSRIAANTDGTWQLIADGPGDFGNLCAAAAATGPGQSAKEHVLSHVEFEAPITPRSIIAVGLNYFDHIIETGMEAPTVPPSFRQAHFLGDRARERHRGRPLDHPTSGLGG